MNYQNNICLIGGNGFLGTSFRRQNGSLFHKIVIISRSGNNILLNENEVFYSVNNLGVDEIANIFEKEQITTVIDLAYNTVPKTSFDNPVADFSENLLNINIYLEAVVQKGNCKYLYISSGGTVYGSCIEKKSIKESYKNVPLSPYGITKLTCERYVLMYREIYNLNASIIRPSNIYGPGQRPFRGQGLIATIMGMALRNEPISVFGDGSHVRDYLYVDDFNKALAMLIQPALPGEIYNIGYGSGISIIEVIEKIERHLSVEGLKLKKKFLPVRPFDVHFNVLNIDKISNLTDWKPSTQLDFGIAKTWQWIKENIK